MATAIRIQRLEQYLYRTRSDVMTGDDARMIADEINDVLEEKDELKDENEELE